MKRNKRISINFTEEEKERIRNIAMYESGLSMASFIRRIIFMNIRQLEMESKGGIMKKNN